MGKDRFSSDFSVPLKVWGRRGLACRKLGLGLISGVGFGVIGFLGLEAGGLRFLFVLTGFSWTAVFVEASKGVHESCASAFASCKESNARSFMQYSLVDTEDF